jgi:hypothetical protein
MAEEPMIFGLRPRAPAPLVWCIVTADSEVEARQVAEEQSPDDLLVDWLAADEVECTRVMHMGGSPPPKGTASYFYERTDEGSAFRFA